MFQNVYESVWRKLCYFTNKEPCKRSAPTIQLPFGFKSLYILRYKPFWEPKRCEIDESTGQFLSGHFRK